MSDHCLECLNKNYHTLIVSQEECLTNNCSKLYKLLPPTIVRKYGEVVPNKTREILLCSNGPYT